MRGGGEGTHVLGVIFSTPSLNFLSGNFRMKIN